MPRNWQLILPICVMVFAVPALAEVADKEPSAAAIWQVLIVLLLLSFVTAFWRWLLALPIWAFSAFLGWGLLLEVNDPNVAPAIVRELGQTYVDQAHYAAVLHLIGPGVLIGLAVLIRRARQQRRQ